MVKRWDRVVFGAALGASMIGAFWLATPRSYAHAGMGYAMSVPGLLRPGLTPVVVQAVKPTGARISWKSTWRGESVVLYGRTPKLYPHMVDRARAAGDSEAELANLAPGTRYYFQVETHTPMGVAVSAVCSFRTREP